MSDGSAIEWLAWPGTKPATWNPVVGCTRVNEGCRNCYAERRANRLANNPATPQYAGTIDGNGRWSGRVNLVREALEKPLRWRAPRTVFVDSMSDLFHPAVPLGFTYRVFAVMALTPRHRYVVLTKRGAWMAEAMRNPDFSRSVDKALLKVVADLKVTRPYVQQPSTMWPLPNVILGVSVVDQASADEQIGYLLRTPAACRAVSYEPALGPVDFSKWLANTKTVHLGMSVRGAIRNRAFDCFTDEKTGKTLSNAAAEAELLELLSKGVEMLPIGKCPSFDSKTGCPGHPHPRIDWLIAGGESGPKARPMHPDWARSARDQCQAAAVPFFFKQFGEWMPLEDWRRLPPDPEGPTFAQMPSDRVTIVSPYGLGDDRAAVNNVEMARVGKKAAGAVLDGREWREVPNAEFGIRNAE